MYTAALTNETAVEALQVADYCCSPTVEETVPICLHFVIILLRSLLVYATYVLSSRL